MLTPKKSYRVILPAFIIAFITAACWPLTSSELISSPISSPLSPEPSKTSSFIAGDPTATPLGEEIIDPRYQEGKEAHKAENYQQVLISMQAVLESSPNLAPPHWYRGRAFYFLGDCVSGMDEMNKALALDPEYALAWADHGLLNSCLGNEAESLQDFMKALELDPSLAKVHHNLGVHYFYQGDYLQAIHHYDLAITIDPTRAFTWTNRAEALEKMGMLAECIESATKAIGIDDSFWIAYRVRSYCESELGNFAYTAEDLALYLSEIPDDATAWYNYGIALRNIGDLEAALTAYSTTLELDPEYYEALINRGVVYLKLSEYQKAFDDENAALQFGNIPLAYMNRGQASFGLGNIELAIADYEAAVSLAPSFPTPFLHLTIAYFEIEHYERALFAADNLNLLDPSSNQNQGLLEMQARSHYALGNYPEAISYINEALDVGEFQLAYYYRGLIHQAAGNDDEARQDLEHFLSLSEGSPTLDEERKEATELLNGL